MIPDTRPPTPRQLQVLDFVLAWTQLQQRPPTRAEIGRAIGVSTTRAQQLIAVLIRKGYIRLAAGTHRGITVTRKGQPKNRPPALPVRSSHDDTTVPRDAHGRAIAGG